ncbi:unnamed protein product [Linum trigynum]|uniref:Uncharacterized protein n=1 Tax=Linum trigynum TaxID=586398 RepID=A0AAV2CDV2_9ROSI
MEMELPKGTIRYSSNVISMEDLGSDSGCLVKSLHLSDIGEAPRPPSSLAVTPRLRSSPAAAPRLRSSPAAATTVVEVLKEQIKELSTDKEHIESTLNRVTMDLSLGSKEELRLSELFHQLKADIDKEKLHLSEQVEKLKGVLNDEIAQGRAHAEASSMSLSSKFSKLQDSACKKISKLETMIRKSMEEKLLTEAALESMRNEYAMTDSEEYRQLLDRATQVKLWGRNRGR